MKIEDAVKVRKGNRYRDWDGQHEDVASKRIYGDAAKICPGTSLKSLGEIESVYCMGSCFAREIEDALDGKSVSVSSKRAFLTLLESNPSLFEPNSGKRFSGRSYQFVNRYNSASMLLDVRNTFGQADLIDELLYEVGQDKFVDYHFSNFLEPKSYAECVLRRSVFKEANLKAFNEANVVVFTLGLCEHFYDSKSGYPFNVTPNPRSVRNQDVEFSFLNYSQNYENVSKIIDTISIFKPEAKIVITVSPVPLSATFTGDDIIIANCRAKSILRCVAGEISDAYENVHYFPSYEIVTNTNPNKAWKEDRIHVEEMLVSHIVKTFGA